jgi:putative transposase
VSVTRKTRRFSGGVYDLGLHVVWCPKYRRPVLERRVAERLDELIRAKADEKGWEVVALEVMPDHVHLFVKHGPKSSASYVANQFKGFSSCVLREEFPHLRSRMPTRCGRRTSPRRSVRSALTRCSGTWAPSGSAPRIGVRGDSVVQVPDAPHQAAAGCTVGDAG